MFFHIKNNLSVMDYSKNKTGVTEWHHDATMKVLRMFFTLKSMIFLRNDDFLTRKSKKRGYLSIVGDAVRKVSMACMACSRTWASVMDSKGKPIAMTRAPRLLEAMPALCPPP